jgi:hypothetical protein
MRSGSTTGALIFRSVRLEALNGESLSREIKFEQKTMKPGLRRKVIQNAESHGQNFSRVHGFLLDPVWARIVAQLQPGDFVLVHFGHNDTANSANYPDRATITSGGDETVQIGIGEQGKIIRSYGAYLRHDVGGGSGQGKQFGGYPRPVATQRKLDVPAKGIDVWLASFATAAK